MTWHWDKLHGQFTKYLITRCVKLQFLIVIAPRYTSPPNTLTPRNITLHWSSQPKFEKKCFIGHILKYLGGQCVWEAIFPGGQCFRGTSVSETFVYIELNGNSSLVTQDSFIALQNFAILILIDISIWITSVSFYTQLHKKL